jgi:subtilisin family serine protease
MATPHVAGVAGLLKSHNSNLSASAVEDLLIGSASNSISSSSSFMSDQSSGEDQPRDLITLQTLSRFTNKQLKGTLIASIDGNSSERRSTVRNFNKNDVDGIKSFDIVESSRNSFAVLELSKSVDRSAILNEMLSTDQFNYFEFEQKLSII